MAQWIIQYLLNNQSRLYLFISLPKTKKEKSYLSTTILLAFQIEFAKFEKNFNVGSFPKFIHLPSLSHVPQPFEVTIRLPPFQSTSH
jgi:hypothetical protein